MGTCCQQKHEDTELEEELIGNQLDHKCKMVLLGTGSSGKSTIFRQLQYINNGYEATEQELQSALNIIRRECITSIIILLKKSIFLYQMDADKYSNCYIDLENEIEIKEHIELILKYSNHSMDTMYTMDNIEELSKSIYFIWNLEEIRNTFNERNNFAFTDNMDYFLNKVDDIFNDSYKVYREDMLKCKWRTTSWTTFSYEVKEDWFEISDVGGHRNERRKWIDGFAGTVNAILFVSALSDYANVLLEDENKNAMHESIELFEEIVNAKWFKFSQFILFLNKEDLFRERLKEIPITLCFNDNDDWNGDEYDGPNYEEKIDSNQDNQHFEQVRDASLQFIYQQFIKKNMNPEKMVFMQVTASTDQDNIEKVFCDIQNIIIRSRLKSPLLC